jgi:hypothetical protein
MPSPAIASLEGVRVAVVGGGVFGCTAALELDLAGADVELYESEPAILERASRRNLLRLHRGYHYPRSLETARQARDGAVEFKRRYPTAVTGHGEHHYAIAAHGSRTDAEGFIEFCAKLQLPLEARMPTFLKRDAIASSFVVEESGIDLVRLKQEIERRLERSRVAVRVGEAASQRVIGQYDYVVLAAYASASGFLAAASLPVPRRRFDLCEVCVVRSPDLAGRSVVVLDGPFVSLVPIPRTDLSLLYHVVESVRQRYDDFSDVAADSLAPLLGGPVRPEPGATNFDAMRRGAAEFVIGADHLEYVASAFELRAVLADSFATDARPTEITWVHPKVLLLFSGKISTCVTGAVGVREMMVEDLVASSPGPSLHPQQIGANEIDETATA